MSEKKDSQSKEREVLRQILDLLETLDDESKRNILEIAMKFYRLKNANIKETSTSLLSESMKINSSASPTFSEDRSMSPKQFIVDKNPATDVERVACLAYYLTHYKGQQHFKTIDISMLNTEAAQRKFSNATNATDNATTRGYLVPAGKGMKQLSAAGELYVQKLPDRIAAQEVMAKVRKKKTKKTQNSKSSSK